VAAASEPSRAKPIANWLLRDVQRALRDRELEIERAQLTPRALADLVDAVVSGKTTVQSARGLLPELVEWGGDPIAMIRDRGLEAVSDGDVIGRAVDEVVRAHPVDADRVLAGEAKVLNFLIGQVMKRTGGKANPQVVRDRLIARISAP
jgi:aspartyl-tRNA(Asn)/glutamyl-tRNA(Gln) amidotransferase subunit B